MKKFKFLTLLLTLCLALQCLSVPALAVDEAPIPATTTVTEPTEPTEPPFGTVCIREGCRTIDGMVPLGGNERRLDTAVAAFAYEVTTGTVVYSYNPDIKVSPGTLAKIVNALVVLENANMEDTVVVREAIQSRVPGSAHKLTPHLKSGEQLQVKDLLYGMMLEGANDAAVALAEHVAGTTEAFCQMMNQRVLQMGCTSTEFGNISGLDTATNVSTARDIARIVKEAIKNETFVEVFGTRTYTIPATNLVEERKLLTTNYLIDESTIPQFMNSNVTGGLASATDASGASIACTAKYKGMELVFVTLGGTRTFEENGWQVKTYGNFDEVTELMKYVLNNFKVNKIIYDGMAVNQWAVAGGESHVVGQSTVDVDSVVPKDASMDNLIMKYSVVDRGLTAPIKKGELIATVSVWFRNSCLTEVELFAMGDVKDASATDVTVHGNALNTGKAGGFLSVLGIICVVVLVLAIIYLAFNAYMRSVIRNRRRRRRAERKRNR